MGVHRFNINKYKYGVEGESLEKKMDAKQEHHEHKKYNILKAIFVEATDFWYSDSFSSHTELVGEFLDFNLATFVDMASSSFDK